MRAGGGGWCACQVAGVHLLGVSGSSSLDVADRCGQSRLRARTGWSMALHEMRPVTPHARSSTAPPTCLLPSFWCCSASCLLSPLLPIVTASHCCLRCTSPLPRLSTPSSWLPGWSIQLPANPLLLLPLHVAAVISCLRCATRPPRLSFTS